MARPATLLTAAGVLTLAAATLTIAPSSASPAATPAPSTVGDCYMFTAKQDNGDTWPAVPPVDCNDEHTHETSAVLTVPDTYARYGRLSMPVKAYATMQCLAAAQRVAGKRPTLTFNWTGYLAPASEWDAGNRYVVCLGENITIKRREFAVTPTTGAYTRANNRDWCGSFSNHRNRWLWTDRCQIATSVAVRYDTLRWKNMETMKFPGKAAVTRRITKLAGRNNGWSGAVTKRAAWNNGDRTFTVWSARR